MLRQGYAHYAKHVAAHEGFIEKVAQFICKCNLGTTDITEEIHPFWLSGCVSTRCVKTEEW